MAFLVTSAIIAATYLVVALPFGLTLGRGGVYTISMAAVWGVGAYVFAVLHETSHVGTVWCIVAAVGAAGLGNVAFNLPALRLTVEAFIVSSIAIQLGVSAVLSSLNVTGGDAGFAGIVRPGWAVNNNWFLLVIAAVIALLYLLLDSVMRSPFGLSVDAGRNDAVVAAAARHRTIPRRVELLALAGAMAGLGGVFYAWFYQSLQPSDFSEAVSVTVVLMVVIGGSRSTVGPVLGAILISGLQSLLLYVGLAPTIAGYVQQILFGVVVMLVMYVRPNGIVSPSPGWYGQTRSRRRYAPNVDATAEQASEGSSGARFADAPELSTAERVSVNQAEELLRVDDAVLAFGGVRALDGASISVHRGEILGLVGPNGAGKTTLFNVVSGVLRPDSGTIRYRGKNISSLGMASRASLGIGRTFQGGRLFEDLTLIENVMVGFDWTGTSSLLSAALHRRRARRALGAAAVEAAELMEVLGIPAERFDQIPAESSHGDQMLVGVGRLLAMGCDLLLLDEPAAGLDDGAITRMKSVLKRCTAMGCGVLLVEHNLTLVAELVDELVVLDAGAVIASGAPAEVIRDPRVREVYVGGTEIQPTEEQPSTR